jgi:histidinol-phosphate aminotransferase
VGEADSLRKEIADAEGVAAEQVVIGDVLDAIAMHLAFEGGAGGEFVYSAPGYSAFADAARLAGGKSIAVPLDAQLENDWRALRAAVGTRTRALFIVNPHNPSGTVSEPGVLKNALRAASTSAFVLVDEAYIEYTDERDRAPTSFARAATSPFLGPSRRSADSPVFRSATPSCRRRSPRLGEAGIGNPHSLDRLAVAAASESLRDTAFQATVRQRIAEERT